MLATLLVYFTMLLLALCVGVAVTAALRPDGRWVTLTALPLGVAAYVTLAYLVGIVLPGRAVTWVVVVATVVALVVLTVRRVGRRPEGTSSGSALRAAFAVEPVDLVVLGIGVLAGVLLLVPLFALGFPSTVAISIRDGWARSVNIEWLLEHTMLDTGEPKGSTRPIGVYSSMSPKVGAGFEYLGVALSTLLGRPGYQVAMPLSAAAVPIALCGWVRLWGEATARRLRAPEAVALVVAAISPAFVLAYVDNYLTQFLSLALWPFAVAVALAYFRAPALRNGIVAAIGIIGVAAVYPPLLPWFVPVLVVLALFAPPLPLDRASGLVRKLAGAARALVLLGIGVAVVAPLEMRSSYLSVMSIGGGGRRPNSGFPFFDMDHDLALLLGGIHQFQIPPFGGQATGPHTAVVLVLLAVVVVVAVTALARAVPGRVAIGAVALAVAGITAAVYVKFQSGDAYSYGTYKTLLYGGSLLTGLIVVALMLPARRMQAARFAAVGLCAALWLPVSADLLERQERANLGFREADHALGEQLADLPEDTTVLVEGAAETDTSFTLRQDTAYFGLALDETYQGIGSTQSYFAGGGAEFWRPDQPWTHVVAAGQPTVFDARRQEIWRSEPFRLEKAPPLDVTPFAVSMETDQNLPPKQVRFWTAPVLQPGQDPYELIGGPAELIVSNRHARTVTATLALGLQSLRDERQTVRLSGGTEAEKLTVPRDRAQRVTYDVRVAPRSTATVTIDPGAPVLVPGQPPQPLLSLTEVQIDDGTETTS